MQTERTQPALIYQLWAWFENHKKQTIQVTAIIAVIACVVSYYFWSQNQREANASRELSKIMFMRTATAEEYSNLASQYSGTSAGANALLMAAQTLFAAGKYPEAQAQFQKFRTDYRASQFLGTALFGIATCLDAQGKTDEAIAAYEDLVQRRAGDMVALQSEFALARLYESQNKLDKALAAYDTVSQMGGTGTYGAEAGIHAHELRAQHPTLAKAAEAPADLPPATLK